MTQRLLGKFWKEEAAESDDYSHIVQPYRFEPYLAMSGGVFSPTGNWYGFLIRICLYLEYCLRGQAFRSCTRCVM